VKTYKANATVLGLRVGDTFESDEPFYARLAKSGVIEEVPDGGATSTPIEEPQPDPGEDEPGSPDPAGGTGGGEGETTVLKPHSRRKRRSDSDEQSPSSGGEPT
jgi:hypothetical protein